MMESILLVALSLVIIYNAVAVGKLLERIHVFKVLNSTVDAIDEISEKPAQYRLGYLAALDKVGQGVHNK